MTNLNLEREMRTVLLALEMTSCGKTASFDANGGGAFGSKAPVSGDMNPPHVFYRQQWNDAYDETSRHWVLERAKDELDAIRKSRAGEGSETEAERTERLLHEGETFSAREVAVRFSMTEAAVRKTRLRHGRDPGRGLDEPMKAMPDGTVDERRKRAKVLMGEHGLSLRRAALVMGVSHETVRRDLMRRDATRRAA